MRPIGLHGAVAGWTGGQDFRTAMRAEDEVLLKWLATLWTGPRGRRNHRAGRGLCVLMTIVMIMGGMQEVRAAHDLLLN